MHRLSISLFLFLGLLFTSSCSEELANKTLKELADETLTAKMLFKVEYREFFKDRITEYRFFDEPILNTTVLHDPGINDPSFTNFDSKLERISPLKFGKAKIIARKLKELKYKNRFPWKENFKDRGDVVKVYCIQEEIPVIADSKGEYKPVPLSKVFIFYTGHIKEEPEIFRDILGLIR